mmetsp:Transcript_23235/g.57034  ORF Transcript_23235/g.57034 Transcript_23235/m.57034 type:complete len:81 (+) Transcript_23235:107-349(+)|eukprot:CAMPEP_0197576220 /NCGR_PEP_ID=MMETSP1326-20131121/1321_1 /TAXON_ID=1155430 /ORGANISM="Genus nov. species nov., Strain RCC2288" /LENGTH=80 /DNA_ID=CAMNT_0043139095 /DNA_START=104 /DNA_END=346 /DNA_ORIENTATION=-
MGRGSGTTKDMRIWVETVNKEDKIAKKSEDRFFDRDKVKWVSWDKEAEAFKAVAGEEALSPDKKKIHYPTTKSRVFSAVD